MSDDPKTTDDWSIETRRMSWGEWRASAIRLGSFDRAIDGPYRETEHEAVTALREQLKNV